MQTTTAPVENIPAALHSSLQAAGLTPASTTRIIGLLPPAGQHALLVAVHSSPHAWRDLTTGFIGDVADQLRVTWAEAALIRAELATVAA